jgi:hypothetical protein
VLQDLVGLAGVPFVVALVEGTKATFPALDKRFYALVAIARALALNLVAAAVLDTPWVEAGVEGLAAGLAAAGLYSATKAAFGRLSTGGQNRP